MAYVVKRTETMRASLGLVLVLAGLGCGGAQKGAEGAETAGTEAKHGTPWKHKNREQRLDWMGLQVFPKLRQAFVERDPAYANFKCQTCHGSKMEMVDFKMPNPGLFSLPKANPIESARDYDADVANFMVEKVVPTMAELLDMPAYDPETKQGFGCFGCHPSDAE
jgi:hypothetical protein